MYNLNFCDILDKESSHLSTFIANFGILHFLYYFEISSAFEHFLHKMFQALEGLVGVIFYIDDIIKDQFNQKECNVNFRSILNRLKETKIDQNKQICCFSVEFFGYLNEESGIYPGQKK